MHVGNSRLYLLKKKNDRLLILYRYFKTVLFLFFIHSSVMLLIYINKRSISGNLSDEHLFLTFKLRLIELKFTKYIRKMVL